ncbi:MAG: response regulator [Anaerolineae bacterium]
MITADKILIVSPDNGLSSSLVDALQKGSGYTTTPVCGFTEALDALVKDRYGVVITSVALPELSGMDLLAMVGTIRPETRVILLDAELSAKSAVAALRLGAADYLYHPFNLDLVLMSVKRAFEQRREQETAVEQPKSASPDNRKDEREHRIDPKRRPAALMLNHTQYKAVERHLYLLNQQIHAEFVGLYDAAHNVVSAVGKLDSLDWLSLRQVLPGDQNMGKLALLLGYDFTHTHFEVSTHSVFVVGFGKPHPVSLVVVCNAENKQGLVWLSTKRTASAINDVLKSGGRPVPNKVVTSSN